MRGYLWRTFDVILLKIDSLLFISFRSLWQEIDWSTVANQKTASLFMEGSQRLMAHVRSIFWMGIGIIGVPTAVASDNTRLHWRRRGHDGQGQINGDGDAICSRFCLPWFNYNARNQWGFGCDYASVVRGKIHMTGGDYGSEGNGFIVKNDQQYF